MDDEAVIKELESNLEFMARKLEETRNVLANAGVAVSSNNSSGHKVLKRNPVFDGYNALMTTYERTLSQLKELKGECHGKQRGFERAPK